MQINAETIVICFSIFWNHLVRQTATIY